ncbi:hypothetical protein MUN81_22590 (plasmid) [Hymenobacter sp. 5317J-9]|uniref:hypothetical protein n=1 Tax=unclassified Hymenobacter TaxID=2615202 RepID=UPI0018EC4FCC|nr:MULTISPECIES: hypothetical protein [unclassified Hymenobacter]MBJ6111831.1 hypothetical protein [Hymenobacter sp. BT523]UOR00195.1 hypothetical protein MUN81_22590 [Hymenobacter sp. 5317J-9]
MKPSLFKTAFVLLLLTTVYSAHAQGDYSLQSRGKVSVSWRLVSDFQREGATCWGWTYHIFIANMNPFPITLKENEAYQNNGDGSSCWQGGSVDLTDRVIPAGKWVDYTFRVSSASGGRPGQPGLRRAIEWNQRTGYQQNID